MRSLCLRCGDSLAVCNGPLLPHTGLLRVFKMLQVCVLCHRPVHCLPLCGFNALFFLSLCSLDF